MIGKSVRIAATDHDHADQEGTVVGRVACGVCGGECGHDDLVVQLPDGTESRVYELEVDS